MRHMRRRIPWQYTVGRNRRAIQGKAAQRRLDLRLPLPPPSVPPFPAIFNEKMICKCFINDF